MNDTPRTDALVGHRETGPTIWDLSRALERELAACDAQAQRSSTALYNAEVTIARLREALEAAKSELERATGA